MKSKIIDVLVLTALIYTAFNVGCSKVPEEHQPSDCTKAQAKVQQEFVRTVLLEEPKIKDLVDDAKKACGIK